MTDSECLVAIIESSEAKIMAKTDAREDLMSAMKASHDGGLPIKDWCESG
jgi:hypothetical protein